MMDGHFCTLRKKLEIRRSDFGAWHCLASYHYRPHRFGPIDSIYAIYPRQAHRLFGREPVGVIVYMMPVPHNHLRNLATANRYVNLGSQGAALAMLNKEIRCISRVVIHPQYRGISLATWLVKETLPLMSTPLVEASAVMARVNSFFERAGMVRYDGPATAQSVRLEEAFGYVGVGEDVYGNAARLVEVIEAMGGERRKFVMRELKCFLRCHVTEVPGDLGGVVSLAVYYLLSRPVYFLWENINGI